MIELFIGRLCAGTAINPGTGVQNVRRVLVMSVNPKMRRRRFEKSIYPAQRAGDFPLPAVRSGAKNHTAFAAYHIL